MWQHDIDFFVSKITFSFWEHFWDSFRCYMGRTPYLLKPLAKELLNNMSDASYSVWYRSFRSFLLKSTQVVLWCWVLVLFLPTSCWVNQMTQKSFQKNPAWFAYEVKRKRIMWSVKSHWQEQLSTDSSGYCGNEAVATENIKVQKN